jgi:hypothetical protein
MADREVQRSPNMAKSTNNKHGLSRTIPSDVGAEIRRRSKYGCVICRALPYDYEHFDPEFPEAHKHNPAGICLLCTMHHAEATRRRLSKSQVRAAYEKVQKTDDVRPAFYHPEITGSLRLGLGDALFEHMPANACVLEYDGVPVLQVGYIQDEVFGGTRPSITGSIFDIKGVELLRIEDNVMTFQAKNVDVRLEGSVLKISGLDRDPVFEMILDPPGGVRINRLRMSYKEVVCEMDDTFGLTLPLVNGETARCLVAGIRTKGARAAISYTSDRSLWHSNEGKMVGGEGIVVPNSGATLAAGAGAMEIPRFRFETLE